MLECLILGVFYYVIVRVFMKTIVYKIILITIILALSFCFTSCVSTKDTFRIATVDDINGHNIGLLTGSLSIDAYDKSFDLSNISYYSTSGDAATALKEGKIDAFFIDRGISKDITKSNDDLTYINESLITLNYGLIFKKTPEGKSKQEDFNSFLADYINSGKLTALYNNWVVQGNDKVIDYESLPNVNGTIKVASDIQCYPYTYSYEGKVTGFEVELLYDYCKDRGYSLSFNIVEFSGVLASVSADKVDIGASSIVYTNERADVFYFSDLYATSDFVAVIRKENATCKYNNLSDLENKNLAVLTGAISDQWAKAVIKGIQCSYYNTTSDIIEAVIYERSDAAVLGEITYSNELQDRKDLKIVGSVGAEQCGYIFPQTQDGEQLKVQVNEFIKASEENGLLERITQEWKSKTSAKHVDFEGLKDINGSLVYAACSTIGEPACYYKDGQIIGLDIDFIVEFAKAYGYDLKIVDYSFSGMLQAVQANLVDFGGSNTTITEERKQSVLFSDPYFKGEVIVVVKDLTATNENNSFFQRLYNSFEKTFIKEDRYQLFISGILNTILITLISTICGVIIGFIWFFVYSMNNYRINHLLNSIASILSEMPTVVLLMIFYYLIFKNSNLNSTYISIIAFTTVFSFSIMSILNTCIASIDKGQFEAAYALGYSKYNSYIKLIIPQIMPMFMTLFKSELVTLVKSTSIVGYIAVQDLTKVSDIVRSRTYQAFFPLIASTIVYILIIKLFKQVISIAINSINSTDKEKSHILKGVDLHD